MTKGSTIIKGALILTLAGIITRILGFIYRIYIAGEIGAEGMGLYQLIIPLYTMAWSISCAGITTTVSKLVAAEAADGNKANLRRITYISIFLTTALGLAVMSILFIGADFIANNLLNDARTVMSIRILAPIVPFMAAGSAIRGYFTGLSKMHIPATSQVLEQVVRMVVIAIALQAVAGRGLEFAAAAAVIGVGAGEVLSFLFVLFMYRCDRMKNNEAAAADGPTMRKRVALITIVSMSLPLTLNRVTGSLLSAVENVFIPRSLQAYGLSAGEAMAEFGRITGMAMPLIFFPSAFLVSLSVSLVPAVSESVAKKTLPNLEPILSKAFFFTILVGIGAAALFLSFSAELGMAIYSQNIGQILFLMAFVCPLWYINITINGVLNGLGAMGTVFKNNLISSAITILSIIFFVPRFGIAAFAGGWFFGVLCQVILSMVKIRKTIKVRIQPVKYIIKPALAAAGAGLLARLLAGRVLFPAFGQTVGIIMAVALVLALYITFMLFIGVLSGKDIIVATRKITNSIKRKS
ncbi:MAG: polysaccharide biosynthesis protein [Defluviitaleaceae bacterium]|nr:polysaccharide biosynthesis protein [Defluviitaleaceae bacterium]